MTQKPILLVEDDLDDVELLELHLKRLSLDREMLVSRDGVEALRLLDSLRRKDPALLPELIIADIKMPRMTGLELIRTLHGDPELKAIPVVFLTSSDDFRDRAEAARWGARLYLKKPLEYEQFMEIAGQIKALVSRLENPASSC